MNRFVKVGELKQIDLGEGDWVKIPAKFSFEFLTQFGDIKNNSEKSLKLVQNAIVEWNLKDENGNDMPPTPDNIKSLDVQTATAILEVILPMISIEKKA